MSLPRVLRAVPVVVPISHAPEAKKKRNKVMNNSVYQCLIVFALHAATALQQKA